MAIRRHLTDPGLLPGILLFAVLALLPLRALARSTAGAYKGAIVLDATTGRVLFERNADAISPPASMTKLMTFAVLMDEIQQKRISLATKVEVTAADARVGAMRDSTSVWLRRGEVFTVEELVYAMLIQSANDAAYALSQAGGLSVDEFVGLMNAKARELGMTRSTFRTPNGFPVPSHRIADGDLTTPRDFARLCRYLLLNTDILHYTSVRKRAFGYGVRAEPVLMTNHNHLLGRVEGVDGLKTGFTDGAGSCLSATAQRNGRRIIVVMMDSPDHRTRDLNMVKLIQDGFESLPEGSPPFRGAYGGSDPRNTEAAPSGAGPFNPVPAAPAPQAAAPADPAEPTRPTIHFPGASLN